ncbi:MAG: hypothetical protein FWE24_00370 [Defluviitaleaceae bacterium]|nr:hypothetical protein [Defluviitaleaceae bacterium]
MEKDNKEVMIKAAFDSINIPEADAIKDIRARMDKKPARPFKRAFVVAFMAASVMMSVVMVAAYYVGSFDRLRGIVGENIAAVIQPARGEIITEDGVRAEFIATGAFDNVVDVFITIEDMVGDRFSGNRFMLSAITGMEFNMYPVGFEAMDSATIFSPQVIHNENGVVTLHGRGVFPFSVNGMELNFEIGRIYYGTNFSRIVRPIDLAAMDIPIDPPALLLDGEKVLKPHQIDYDFGIRNVFEQISSIGWVDGKLHIQLYNPSRSNPWLTFVRPLERAQGYEHFNHLIYRFDGIDFDEAGNPFFAVWQPFPLYFEIVFDITPEILLEYDFHGTFTGFEYMNLDWYTIFTVEANEAQLKADGFEVAVGSSVVNEVIVNPSGIRLSGFYTSPREESVLDNNRAIVTGVSSISPMETNQALWLDISGYYTGDRISLVVNTTDGIHRGVLNYFTRDDDGNFTHIFGFNRFIDLDTVVSVGIAGRQLIYFPAQKN